MKSAYLAAVVSLVVAMAAVTVIAFNLVGSSGGQRPAFRSPQITEVSIVLGSINPNQPDNYVPKSLILIVGVNNTVRWTNGDVPIAHTVTSVTGVFDSGNMNAGDVWEYTFTGQGTFAYICTYHPWMNGSVTVTSG